ncbi:MAG: hypothetical protein K9L64_05915 [Candidatus Izimaplasma sp.]|nr:hypothetical protein [Candidatus Izimaplasma bacterium]
MIQLKNVVNYIKKHELILLYLMIFVFIIYALLTATLNTNKMMNLVFSILFIGLVIYGFFVAYKSEENMQLKRLKLLEWDSIAVIIGVVLTFSLVEYLSVPVIIASAAVGLAGHFLIKNYEVAIYCGSFAGMISPFIFNFGEVLILAFFAALYFMFTKRIFKGYGGKLGTTAFLASVTTAFILNKSFFTLDISSDFYLLFIISILGVISTYLVQHNLKQTAVMASATTSIVFAGVLFVLDINVIYSAIFFTASFIGMTNKIVIPNTYVAFISAIVLAVVFYLFEPYFNGAGGKMGMMAFTSVVITTSILKINQLFIKDDIPE